MLTAPILAKLDADGNKLDVAPIINDAVTSQPLRFPVTIDRLAELAAAIGYVETHWGFAKGKPETTGASIIGSDDSGNGYMQIDAHAHPDLVADGRMLIPANNIRAGVCILAAALQDFAGRLDVERCGCAAYNAGSHHVSVAVHAGKLPDAVTEGGDYTKRVDAALEMYGFAPLDSASDARV